MTNQEDIKEIEENEVVNNCMADVYDEFISATSMYPAFHSAHEGYAVLLEELDELWEHIKVKDGFRILSAMRKEAIQVAAMALRFIVDVCEKEKYK